MIFGLFKKKEDPEGKPVAEAIHYFRKVKVAVLRIKKDNLTVGDKVRIKGHTTDFKEKIVSMEIDHKTVQKASKGKEVAIKVRGKVRRGDKVWKI